MTSLHALAFYTVSSLCWCALHAYAAWQLIHPLRLAGTSASLTWGGVLALAIGTPLALALTYDAGAHPVGQAVRNAAYLYMGVFSLLFVGALVRHGFVGTVGAIERVAPSAVPSAFAGQRRRLLALLGTAAVFSGAGVLSALAWRSAARTPPIVRREVFFPGLPASLDGFRIAQLSDLHVGAPTTRAQLEAIVDRTNALEADVIALTGDLVDGSVRSLASEVEPIRALSARHGKLFVTGNHEYYSGARSWERAVTELGFTVLTNEHTVVEVDGASLLIGGVTDYDAGRFVPHDASDPERSLADASDVALKVLLAHQPKSVVAAERAGYDLQLSGHTHGGQFVPWTWVVDLFHPVPAGLTRFGRMQVYVSRGTAVWGPPMRLGAPSEITEIVLRRG